MTSRPCLPETEGVFFPWKKRVFSPFKSLKNREHPTALVRIKVGSVHCTTWSYL